MASADILGAHRVAFLGYVDSGMIGTPENDAAESFWQADVEEAAERLAEILREESADVLTVYDDNGSYGHPDHIQVHRVGMRAAELAGVDRVYQSTINRDHILRGMRERAVAAGGDIELPDFDDEQLRGQRGPHQRGCRRDAVARAQAPGHAGPRQPDQRAVVLPVDAARSVRVRVRHRVVHPRRAGPGHHRDVVVVSLLDVGAARARRGGVGGSPTPGWIDRRPRGRAGGHGRRALGAARPVAGGRRSGLRRCAETAEVAVRACWASTPRSTRRVEEIPTPAGMSLDDRSTWLRGLVGGTWSDGAPELAGWRGDVVDALLSLDTDTVVVTHFVAINVAVGRASDDDRFVCFRPDNCSRTVLENDGGRAAARRARRRGADAGALMAAEWRHTALAQQIIFGAGAVARLPDVLKALGARRALLVTTAGRLESDDGQSVVAALGRSVASTFADVESHVPVPLVQRAVLAGPAGRGGRRGVVRRRVVRGHGQGGLLLHGAGDGDARRVLGRPPRAAARVDSRRPTPAPSSRRSSG